MHACRDLEQRLASRRRPSRRRRDLPAIPDSPCESFDQLIDRQPDGADDSSTMTATLRAGGLIVVIVLVGLTAACDGSSSSSSASSSTTGTTTNART
jgi:hypothetical protein